MIYEINNKYYVKVGYEYNEIEIKLDKHGEVVLVPLKNRIDGTGKIIKEIAFQNEKENFKKKLQQKQQPKQQPKQQTKSIEKETNKISKKYRWG